MQFGPIRRMPRRRQTASSSVCELLPRAAGLGEPRRDHDQRAHALLARTPWRRRARARLAPRRSRRRRASATSLDAGVRPPRLERLGWRGSRGGRRRRTASRAGCEACGRRSRRDPGKRRSPRPTAARGVRRPPRQRRHACAARSARPSRGAHCGRELDLDGAGLGMDQDREAASSEDVDHRVILRQHIGRRRMGYRCPMPRPARWAIRIDARPRPRNGSDTLIAISAEPVTLADVLGAADDPRLVIAHEGEQGQRSM